MSSPILKKVRNKLLNYAKGNVLEIGIGGGFNLSEYPHSIKRITAIDTNPGFDSYLKKRIANSKIDVHHIVASAESLPFSDKTFDTVVSTWTFCSIDNIDVALREVRRVLKPDGKLIFVEHVVSDGWFTKLLQHCITPMWRHYKGGCHLDRNIKSIIENNGFTLDEYQEYDMQGTKRITRHTSQGIASLTQNFDTGRFRKHKQ